ncbi:MAG: hypothetical protein KAX13_12740, partial [Candidatus Krumholzibacteria bacterium]|nr:hypothetical protein [Candidatus Krumholzibacteria bacterium]
MKDYAVIGAGQMGRVIAKELIDSGTGSEVSLFDISSTLLDEAAHSIASDRLSTQVLDITDTATASGALEDHTVAIGALPHSMS